MSWDRIIQDSDEDEPFVEDEVPTSIAPIQGQEPLPHHEPRDRPADQHTTNHVSEQVYAPEHQLSVDFDQFLQSQDMPHASITASQQKREEMWIPPTGDGGESIGAMMTEIGLAQQRLFDDEGSNTGNHHHSMSTTYPSGISEPGSFPMHYDHQGQNGNLPPTRPPPDIQNEATQLVAPHTTNGYQYSTPAESAHVDLPITNVDGMGTTDVPGHLNEINFHKPAQRSKSMHTEWNSPHDTEPNSSVRSPQLNRSKSDHGQAALISPTSPVSTVDELSAPAFAVQIAGPDIASAVKRRGRPKKQPVPQYDDDDDELAMIVDSGFSKAKPEKRRPGRSSKSEKATRQADGASAQEAINGSEAAEVSEQPAQQAKPGPKKKKIKRSKTAPEALHKAGKVDDDDVIWVESKPLEMENANATMNHVNENADASKVSEQIQFEIPVVSNEYVEAPAPAPKKRGRKRKKTDEQTDAPAASKDPQLESKNEVPTLPETTEQHAPIPDPPKGDEKEDITLGKQSESESTPQPDKLTKQTAAGSLPQTPQIAKPRKVHSPISSTGKVPYRIGLSKRARIAPLLKVVRK
ncbi:hypothetical protein N7481_005199 [Penicillium waksmanii]|uniref:uncharacterized protein n=1 Tax=Penicillium waksmanii TaxID=69791 RepID=UPI0025489643|nr:uncharacterized protein N7481_005199 [Penicillium waksmanii]KAJ5983100.1 hypothetical protein N7481_005199 [Penicillium waksmanii]